MWVIKCEPPVATTIELDPKDLRQIFVDGAGRRGKLFFLKIVKVL